MGIDRKYGHVTTERGDIGADEPVVVFRAQDALLGEVLTHYHELCRLAGSPPHHLDLILGNRDEVVEWQSGNATKTPDSSGWNANE